MLIVDDHPLVREGTQALVAAHPGIEVVGSAANAATARRLLTECEPDVMLLDIRLPDATGLDVARFAQAVRPSTAVLILTGYDEVGYSRALLEIGVRGYLKKTASSLDIIAAILKVAAGQVVIGKDVVDLPEFANTEALTERELEVLRLLACGERNVEVATKLGISIKTVEFHVGNLLGKLGARSRVEAILLGRQRGYLA